MRRSAPPRSAEHDGFDAADVGKRGYDALKKRIGRHTTPFTA
jgi:hypothetical protein